MFKNKLKLKSVQTLWVHGVPKKCLQDCLNNIYGYKNARWLRHVSFERWDLQLRLEYKGISVQYQGAEI